MSIIKVPKNSLVMTYNKDIIKPGREIDTEKIYYMMTIEKLTDSQFIVLVTTYNSNEQSTNKVPYLRIDFKSTDKIQIINRMDFEISTMLCFKMVQEYQE